MALLAMLLLPAATADAAGSPPPGKGKALTAQQQAAKDARIARRHAKLDLQLNDAVEDAANAESNVIIEFYDETGAVNLVKSHGGKAGRRLGILNARVAKLSNRKLKLLASDPRVKKIHLDRPTEGFVGRTAVTVGARAVQELMGYNGAGVGVAIVDSGITGWHDDLTVADGQGQRVSHFVDFVNGYTQPYDDWGHGTHVAGIVAGNGFDSNGTRNAIAPGANIISLKALDAQGHGTISNIIAAIDYAVANKTALNIRVINLSLGAGVYESYNTDPLTLAAKRAVDAGIVVVAAAGNLGKAADGQAQYGGIGSPGNAPWVITVGASSTNGTVRRQDDTMAAFSSRGPTMYDYAAKPDLAAPGYGTVSLSDPLSAFYTTKAQFLLDGLVTPGYTPYIALSGTSMAAPVVSGTVALMMQANPDLTPNLVKAILQFTSQEYPGYDPLTQGTGFLNARGAVQLSEYFRNHLRGSAYPSMNGWSKQIFWGNKRVTGGVLTPGGTAWQLGLVWGSFPQGTNIVWGENCLEASCSDNIVWGNNIVWGDSAGDDNIVWGNTDDDNIVWGNGDDDNIVWGNGEEDNIVWGNDGDDNIVWGNDCAGENCDNIVWGNDDGDNIVWGNADEYGVDNIVWGNQDDDNIVWGNNDDDNIVWGNDDGDNIVWGNNDDDNIVWGNTVNQAVQQISFEAEAVEVSSLPSSMWDALFPLDAQWPSNDVPPPPPPADDTNTPPPAPPVDDTTVPPPPPPTDPVPPPPTDPPPAPPVEQPPAPPADDTTVPPPPADDTTVPPPPADDTTVPPPPPADDTTVPPPPPPTDPVPPPPTDTTTTDTTITTTDTTVAPPPVDSTTTTTSSDGTTTTTTTSSDGTITTTTTSSDGTTTTTTTPPPVPPTGGGF
jgi:serine protease AprX